MIGRIACCLLAFGTAVAAQAPQEFEVASVRPSAEQVTQVSVGVHFSGSQVRINYLSLKDYIGIAYAVQPAQISGPDWIGQLRFDIAAKLPEGSSQEQIPKMLEKLLADRFDLQIHRESKEFPVYALVVTKSGVKLRESSPADTNPSGAVSVASSGSSAGVFLDLGGGTSFSLGNNKIQVTKSTMADLVESLTRLTDRPVIDKTGIAGQYDLTLDLSPEDYNAIMIRSAINAGVVLPPQALRGLDGASADPLSPPLQKYGLTLESRRAPLDVIVVDSMRKAPREN